jgi:hypothetical protein
MMRRLGTVKKEKVLENKGGILRRKVLGRIIRVVGTWNRKPQILF